MPQGKGAKMEANMEIYEFLRVWMMDTMKPRFLAILAAYLREF